MRDCQGEKHPESHKRDEARRKNIRGFEVGKDTKVVGKITWSNSN